MTNNPHRNLTPRIGMYFLAGLGILTLTFAPPLGLGILAAAGLVYLLTRVDRVIDRAMDKLAKK